MRRRNNNDSFLPMTFGVCLLLTIGAYWGLKNKERISHKQYPQPQLQQPSLEIPNAENLIKVEPEEQEETILEFKLDVLYSTNAEKNDAINTKEELNQMSLSYEQNFFRRSSHELYRSARKELDKVIPQLQKHGNIIVTINGHTDGRSIFKRNYRKWNTQKKLADLRATAVQDYLIKKGVNPYNIVITQDSHKQKNMKNNRGVTLMFKPVPTSSTLAGVIQ